MSFFANLLAVDAADYLKEPLFTQVLDSLQFDVYNGWFDVTPRVDFQTKLIKYKRSEVRGENNLGYIHFIKDGVTIKKIEIPRDEHKLVIQRDNQYCFFKLKGVWNLYNVDGNLIRTYSFSNTNYEPALTNDYGTTLCISSQSDMFSNTILGYMIIDANDNILLEKQHELARMDFVFSKDGRYCAILEKEWTAPGSRIFFKPESKLYVYDQKFQQIFNHKFSEYWNHSMISISGCMVFVDDVLLLSIQARHFLSSEEEARKISSYKYAAFEVNGRKLFWKKNEK
jgi:hypothetical protein